MFLDASAIIAILGEEEDAGLLLASIEGARGVHFSPISVYEAVIGLARKKTRREGSIPPHLIEQAEEVVARFLVELGAREMPITVEIGREAVTACKFFGRVVGHPAKLNLGDCFAYACARAGRMPLLFKGNDFPHTDVERA